MADRTLTPQSQRLIMAQRIRHRRRAAGTLSGSALLVTLAATDNADLAPAGRDD